MNITEVGINEVSGRKLALLELPSINDFSDSIKLKSKYFGCFLAVDVNASNEAKVYTLANKLLKIGMSFCTCWGENCETAHDLVDSACQNYLPNPTEHYVIMTTWLSEENLTEALWDHLYVSFPAEEYSNESKLDLFIFINKPGSYKLAKKHLSDLNNLNILVVGKD